MYYYNRRLEPIVPSHLYSVTGTLTTAGVTTKGVSPLLLYYFLSVTFFLSPLILI